MPDRVALFIDYQNVRMGARECFHSATDPSSYGQIDPLRLGKLLCARSEPAGERELVDVRVYVGRPSQAKDTKGYAANRRQLAAWQSQGVTTVPRSLRYPKDYPHSPPQEKGIDVSLAIDFVAGAVDHAFDIGIIFSTDTDLLPALELVTKRPGLRVKAEVACWFVSGGNAALSVPGGHVWCHRLREQDYQKVRDKTVYVTQS